MLKPSAVDFKEGGLYIVFFVYGGNIVIAQCYKEDHDLRLGFNHKDGGGFISICGLSAEDYLIGPLKMVSPEYGCSYPE